MTDDSLDDVRPEHPAWMDDRLGLLKLLAEQATAYDKSLDDICKLVAGA